MKFPHHAHLGVAGNLKSKFGLDLNAEVTAGILARGGDMGDGCLVFQVRGLAFRSYNVQMSPGLGTPNWQTIGSVTCDRDGVARFTNGIPASATERYFRTIVPE